MLTRSTKVIEMRPTASGELEADPDQPVRGGGSLILGLLGTLFVLMAGLASIVLSTALLRGFSKGGGLRPAR